MEASSNMIQRNSRELLWGLIRQIDELAQNLKRSANPSGKQFAADLILLPLIIGETFEERLSCYFQLMSVTLSNPLHEKPDDFFRALQPLYQEFRAKFHEGYPQAFAAAIPAEEWTLLDDPRETLATELSKAFTRCLCQCSLETAEEISDLFKLKKSAYQGNNKEVKLAALRLELLAHEQQIRTTLLECMTFMNARELHYQITSLLQNSLLSGTSFLKDALNKALSECHNLPQKDIDADSLAQYNNKLLWDTTPADVFFQIRRLVREYLLWCNGTFNFSLELCKKVATELKKLLSEPQNPENAQDAFRLLSYFCIYFGNDCWTSRDQGIRSRADVKYNHQFRDHLKHLYLKLLVARLIHNAEDIATEIEDRSLPQLLVSPHCEVDFRALEKPYPLQEELPLQTLIKTYVRDADMARRLMKALEENIFKHIDQTYLMLGRQLMKCLYKHSLSCDPHQNLLNDKTARQSRRVIQELAEFFDPAGKKLMEFTGASLRENLVRYNVQIKEACLICGYYPDKLALLKKISDAELQEQIKSLIQPLEYRFYSRALDARKS